MKYLKISLLFTVFQLSAFAGNVDIGGTAQLYVQNFKDNAIKEMLLYNIPASITLAQGMLESGNGTSDLAVLANNHFGIKCHDEWKGSTFIKYDDAKDECFRKYPTVLDSYTDHSLFLKSRARYSKLFELNHTDYRGWAKGLKETGYATDPQYTQRLLELIETYELFRFDLFNQPPKKVKKNSLSLPPKRGREPTHKPHSRGFVGGVISPEFIPTKEGGRQGGAITREILRLGIVKYIIVKPNDTFSKIAKETDKDAWQLFKFNDLSPDDKLIAGQKLYLQSKRRKAIKPFHIVKKGDTMKSISQFYGVKLKLLYKKNNMREWEEPIAGQLLYMRDRKK